MDATKPLRQVLGSSVRRLRESSGLRQDDVAQAARDHGLAWPRPKIAALERGEKSISAEELLLLPVLLRAVLGRTVSWAELFDNDADIDLSSATRVAARDVPAMLDGSTDPSGLVRLIGQPSKRSGSELLVQVSARLRELGLGADSAEIQHHSGETGLRAAQRVGEHHLVYNAITAHLWGRSVSAERDARVAATTPPDAPAATVQARRGRVTRELDDEVRQFISQAQSGSRPVEAVGRW